ncbi:MAG: HAMP domain-containing histidine kinase, partial [Desulfobacterales bacterium]|nr:HAMP domain-containing histidine kinase [Desulfobacterales bacterium]
VAHEINNPVAVINEASGWAAEVIADAKGLSPDDREELEGVVTKIKAQTLRCRNITHKLLGFVRDSDLAKKEFDIHETLKETVDLLKSEVKYTSIEIDMNFVEGPLPVVSDARLLEQVFVNIVANAIHAVVAKGGENGRIEIRTLKRDSQIEVSIEDNGGGIPEEHQDKVFELFYTTKPPGKGTGLGLPICQNIVRNLGGELSFETTVGVGTTFTVQIPAQ